MISNTKLLRLLFVVLPMVGPWVLKPAGNGPGGASAPVMPRQVRQVSESSTRAPMILRRVRQLNDSGIPVLDGKELRCFSITFRFPFYDKQGDKIEGGLLDHSNRVFLYKDLVMYELPYGYSSGRDGMVPDTTETRYRYLVFHRDSVYGVEYDLHFPGKIKHRYVDSVKLSMGGYINKGKPGFFDRDSCPLLSRLLDRAHGYLTEVFVLGDSAHPVLGDTLWLSYSDRYGVLPSNLLVAHDSLPKMRLIGVHARFTCKDMPSQNGIVLDHGEMNWKIEETAFFDRDSAMVFIDKYLEYCRVGK